MNARGLDVVVIGGGDTGNDCVGTAVRQGARSVRQFEFLPAAPDKRAASNPWPQWPNVKKTGYGQQEAIAAMGGEMRAWGVDTLEVLLDKKGAAAGLRVADLDWSAGKPERIAAPSMRCRRSWCSSPAALRVPSTVCSKLSACLLPPLVVRCR